MKLQLEFEESDLYEMIELYFRSNGFKVRDPEHLVECFRIAFPTGIQLLVDPIPSEPPPVYDPRLDDREDVPAQKLPPLVGNIPEKMVEGSHSPTTALNAGNPKLGFADILDPTSGLHPPTRDELLAQSRREIEQILNQSQALQEKNQET